MRNRSQQHRKRDILSQHRSLWRAQLLAWREITGLSRHGGRISRLAGRYGSVAMASYVSPGGAMRVCRYGELCLAWRNDVRTDYGITNFFTQNPIFHHVKPQIRLKQQHYTYSRLCNQFLHQFHSFTSSIH